MKTRKMIFFAGIVVICCLIVVIAGIRIINEKKKEKRMSNIEVINQTSADRIYYDTLLRVEEDATIIVEGKIGKSLGQEVSAPYDYEFQKALPGAGYTNIEVKVTKVHKGNVTVGDKITMSQNFYFWTYEDNTEQLISSSAVKPLEKDETYLLFLKYSERRGTYIPVCDYQGMYPLEETQEKASVKNIEQKDLSHIYQVVEWKGLMPVYEEVRDKYFKD